MGAEKGGFSVVLVGYQTSIDLGTAIRQGVGDGDFRNYGLKGKNKGLGYRS